MTVLSAQSIRRLCLEHDPPMISPFFERTVAGGRTYGLGPCTYDVRSAQQVILPVGKGCLAVTMERFVMPHNVCGQALDKSSHARVFITAFNTHLDPGWEGYLTVELVNHGTETVCWLAGEPLCQIRFDWLDEPTDMPYRGKYQNQPPVPTPAIME